MSKRVTAALIGVTLFLATAWLTCHLTFNFYVEYWWMPIDKYGVRTPLRWQDVAFNAGSAAVKPGVDFEEPIAMLIGPVVYGFLANICYTLGWLVDTISYQGTARIRMYKAGIIFSVVVTALRGVWGVVAWLITVITGHKLG